MTKAININQKCFNMRIDKDLLLFLKITSLQHDCTMTELVTRCLNEYKNKIEKKHAGKSDAV